MGKHQDYLNPGACLKENGHQSSITFETHSKVTAKKEERGGTEGRGMDGDEKGMGGGILQFGERKLIFSGLREGKTVPGVLRRNKRRK